MASAFKSADHLTPRTVKRSGPIAATDGELLSRFVGQRDHRAFAEIVERHGGLVWMTCQQLLRHHQDVEDSFQATFLILAKQARTIRASDSTAGWLFKVAHRTALAARRKRTGRREEPLADEPPAIEEGTHMIDEREMFGVLLQEIRTLPGRYQAPLLMRYLEGRSRRAIAEQTDLTVGQVHGLLVRGRRILRSRFIRGGLSLSLVAGAIPDTAALAKAAVTPTLVASTSRSCLTYITAGASGGLSPGALELVQQGLKAMWMTFFTKCAAVVTTVALTGGIAWAAHQGAGNGKGTTGTSAAIAINSQVAAAAPAKADQPTTAAAETDASRLAKQAAQQRAEYAHQLKGRWEDFEDMMQDRTQDKLKVSAQLEIAKAEKDQLQHEIERLRTALFDHEVAEITASGDSKTDDVQKRRLKNHDDVVRNIDALTGEWQKKIASITDLSIELERKQRSVTHIQRNLDELERLSIQAELPQPPQLTPVSNAAVGQQTAGGTLQLSGSEQQQRRLDQLEQDRAALQAENKELKKQLEDRKNSAPPLPPSQQTYPSR